MWKSIVTATIAVAIAAFIITIKGQSCETKDQQRRAAEITQPFTNPMLVIPAAKNGDSHQDQPQNQASRAEAQTNTYFCSVVTPTNLPTIYLVLIGIGGIAVAISTLKTLDSQTKAAENNIEILISKERARIYIEPVMSISETGDEYDRTYILSYKITCSGTTEAIIYDSRVAAEVGITPERSQPQRGNPIPLPDHFTPCTIELKVPLFGKDDDLNEVLDERLESGELFLNFWGYINYRDIFFKGDGVWRKNFRYIWDAQTERFIRCGEPWENAEKEKPAAKNPH
jgi:hypothetical protein